MSTAQTVVQTTPSQTVIRQEKPLPRTIYDASGFEVFGKHFLAGFSQALGMILVYLIFLGIAFYFAMQYLLPTIQPYLDMYKQSMESLQTIQSTFAPGTTSGAATTFQEGTYTGEFQGTAPGTTTMTVTPEQLRQAQDLMLQMQQNSN